MLEYLNIQLQEVKPSTMDHAQIIMPQGGQIEAPCQDPLMVSVDMNWIAFSTSKLKLRGGDNNKSDHRWYSAA